jgi:hypothetical protein
MGKSDASQREPITRREMIGPNRAFSDRMGSPAGIKCSLNKGWGIFRPNEVARRNKMLAKTDAGAFSDRMP